MRRFDLRINVDQWLYRKQLELKSVLLPSSSIAIVNYGYVLGVGNENEAQAQIEPPRMAVLVFKVYKSSTDRILP